MLQYITLLFTFFLILNLPQEANSLHLKKDLILSPVFFVDLSTAQLPHYKMMVYIDIYICLVEHHCNSKMFGLKDKKNMSKYYFH